MANTIIQQKRVVFRYKEMNRMISYNPFWNTLKKKNITQKTLDTYVFSLLQFCKANNKPLDKMVEEVLEEEAPEEP